MVSGNVNYCSHMEISMKVPQKLKIELSCDPQYHSWAYTGKNVSTYYRDSCTLMFIERYSR
jgi:hypothetical protein